MKLFLSCLSFMLLICFAACKKEYVCDCHTNSDEKVYSLNTTDYGKASNQCNNFKTQYAWDTCTTVELK